MTVRKVIEQRSVEVKHYTCDHCGQETTGRKSCKQCGRDRCNSCSTWDPDGSSDYFCKRCWDIGVPYRARVRALEEKEEEQEELWRDACVKERRDAERVDAEAARAKALSGDRGEAAQSE